ALLPEKTVQHPIYSSPRMTPLSIAPPVPFGFVTTLLEKMLVMIVVGLSVMIAPPPTSALFPVNLLWAIDIVPMLEDSIAPPKLKLLALLLMNVAFQIFSVPSFAMAPPSLPALFCEKVLWEILKVPGLKLTMPPPLKLAAAPNVMVRLNRLRSAPKL